MKVAYVNGVCVHHDAISNSIVEEIRTLQAMGYEVKLYAYAFDHDWIDFECVGNVADIARSQYFLESELVVLHFGIYYPLFNVIPLIPRRAKRLVVFHNITPPHLLTEDKRELIEKSFSQISNMRWVDHVACDSLTNLEVLREANVETPASVISLSVNCLGPVPERKPSFDDGTIRCAFVGRFVRSKGVSEILQGFERILIDAPWSVVQVDFIGNIGFSDPEVVSQLNAQADALRQRFGHRLTVSLHGSAGDEFKYACLRDADLLVLPSYHEGFCVPVVEALASGCRVISYDNSNLPAVGGGLSDLVPTGDTAAFHRVMGSVVTELLSAPWQEGGYAEFAKSAAAHALEFSPERVSRQFGRVVKALLT